MKKIFFLIVYAIQYSLTCFSQDSLHHYTDPEVIKLANHIKNLEKKAAFYIATHPDDIFVVNNGKNAEEKAILSDLIRDSLHSYNDKQVIRIANYIKYLEKLDALNTLALEAKKRYNDSIAKTQVLVIAGQKEIDKYEKLIFFNFDSSVLKEESYAPLDEAVKVLKKFVNSSFVIEGHTDSIGAVAYNLNLSKERAKSVMDYFVSKGIPSSRISSVGYGEGKPIDTNETEAGKAKNRRVEIRLKK
ncbi:MAG: OmpA family protein [Bacteroidota bacterium]